MLKNNTTPFLFPAFRIAFSGETVYLGRKNNGVPFMISIHFSEKLGPVKPLHGINNSPVTFGEPLPELKEAGIPFVRLHDTGGAYGQNRFVDIPNVFPDFSADPEKPESYDFAFTDAMFKGLTASGMQIFYRLGVTIENQYQIRSYRIAPPADSLKWAKICEGIVKHYNCGWANGFHYGIQYWEIWNEPENPMMWSGTREQYFELYRAAANHLKAKFPELKVGGYASCGFYAANRPNLKENAFYQSFLSWFDDFLEYIKAPATKAPLDFYSWHIYTTDIAELRFHADYACNTLAKHGFSGVETILDEWNYTDWKAESPFDEMKEMPGATFVAAAFCTLQNLRTAKAMYYDALPQRAYCGLYYFPSQKVTKTYYSFRIFNELYRLGTQVRCEAPESEGLFALAAAGKSGRAAMIVNMNPGRTPVEFQAEGVSGKPHAVLLDSMHTFTPTETLFDAAGKLVLPGKSVTLLRW